MYWKAMETKSFVSIKEPKAGTKGELGQCYYWTRPLSFSRIQSRAISDLLTGYNNLRRHLYIKGLIDRGGKFSSRCACVYILGDTRTDLFGLFFLDPEDDITRRVGAIWKLINQQGSYDLGVSLRGTKGLSRRPRGIGTGRGRTHSLFYSILFYSIIFYSSILFYSILFYSILFHHILFYSILFHSILFYSILFYHILF